ncbi:PAS domain S-box protein [Pedobacter immunditicola]|uniref:PAS domain S-box protein n=1 Tax=Pedobacter immunditicola TaxID=3133440 RepID=UPI0030A739E6
MKVKLVKPIRIVMLYLIFSLCWILLGVSVVDSLMAVTGAEREVLEVLKGVLFVGVTAALLYMALKKQQQELLTSEKQYRDLFHSNPLPMWIYDSVNLNFLEVNEAAIQNYGYSREEFKKMSILDISKGKDQLINSGTHVALDERNYSGYFQHQKKNGDDIIALIHSHQIIFDNRDSVVDMAQDVTNQLEQDRLLKLMYSTEKELKEELETNILLMERSLEEKQRMAEVVERIYNLVVIVDASYKVTWVNQAFIKFTGYSLEEVVGHSIDFLHGPDTDLQTLDKIQEALKQEQFYVFEVLNYTKTGAEYWVEVSISAIYNDDNEIVRYIAVQNVISERKASEDKIRQQTLVLKKLAWTNSHAFRKPVASILSLVELSKDVTKLEELKEIHRHIAVCSKELDDLTKEIGTVLVERKKNT